MIYGPGDHLCRFHPVLKRIGDGRRVILVEEGWAAWRSPRGYVENVAAALALAATSARAVGRVYNVAEAPAFTELEWAGKIAAATGWDGQFVTLVKGAHAGAFGAARKQRAALGSGFKPYSAGTRLPGSGAAGRSHSPCY
jgi:nucleoside-diphosphate-sugar epimerase